MFRSSSKMSGSDLLGLGDSLVAVGGFADDLQLRLGLEQPTKSIAKDGVIIRNDDANCRNFTIHKFHTLSEER